MKQDKGDWDFGEEGLTDKVSRDLKEIREKQVGKGGKSSQDGENSTYKSLDMAL